MKKLIEINYSNSFYYTSLWYEDKNMRVEDIIDNGNRGIIYNIFRHSGKKEPPEFKIEKNAKVDMFTYRYFDYISDMKVPVFKHIMGDQPFMCKFNNNGKNKMEFRLKFPFDVKILELGNTVLALYNNIDNPFDFKDKVFNEIIYCPNSGSLLIFDYRNKEVYALNNEYKLLFNGRLDDDGNLITYRRKHVTYIYHYSNGEITDHSAVKNEFDVRFIEEKTPHSITRYTLLPYVKTSYGAEVITNSNEIIMYSYNMIAEDNQILKNRYYDLITYTEFERIINEMKNESI